MRTHFLEAELLSDVVVTAFAATEGAHRSLDYVPGAAWLGAAAKALYSKLDAGDAFAAFHSGRVRFGPGFPSSGRQVTTFPVPLSFHREKGARGGAVHNLAADERSPLTRPEQLRGGFVGADGKPLPRLSKGFSLKVGMLARRRNIKAQHDLFGYESLPEGTRLRFSIDADDDVPERLDDAIVEALCGPCVGVGRSRSAEYGRVRVRVIPPWPPVEVGHARDVVRILLESDTALLDLDTGEPTLRPRPAHFGLPDGARLELDRSFLRWRRYTPFNGKRRRPDVERHVLEQGSVLTFLGCEGVDSDALASSLERGVGEHRQDGLGRVRVNPPLLAKASWSWAEEEPAPSVAAEAPQDDVIGWLEDREDERRRIEEAYRAAMTWCNDVRVRRDGPSRAQWGEIRQRAAAAADPSSLERDLFGEGGRLRSGVAARAWGGPDGRGLADQLEQFVRGLDAPLRLPALQLVAKRMAERTREQEEGR